MFGVDILQPTHLLLILLVALLVLGPKRLPEVGRSLGRGLRDFRQGIQGVQDEARGVFNDALDDPSQPPLDSAESTVPEPLNPPTAEPLSLQAAEEPNLETAEPLISSTPAPVAASMPSASRAAMTKVAPVESDPGEYAD